MSTPAADYRASIFEAERFTRIGEGHYRLDVREVGMVLDINRLRRESEALVGELVVRCNLPGAATYEGILSAGDLNLSSVRARQDRAKYLAQRARSDEIDFAGLLEELAFRVIGADREGEPMVLLRDIPKPAADDGISVENLPLLRRHPVILFGDGGAAKSYVALYLAGRLEQQGLRTGVFDWELAGEDHRVRLELLFGPEKMPAVHYRRCDRPLHYSVDRLRRDAELHRLDYLIYDSVAFACDGPAEAAEVAARYFQAVRQIGIGSLHVAHVSKAEGSEFKPFGSAFWHNGARATWYVKLAEGLPGSGCVTIALHNRKQNLGPLAPALGYEITFSQNETAFRRVDVADTDLAASLTVRQRIAHALRGGSLTIADLAEQLEVKTDTIEKTVKRGAGKVFTYLPGPDGSHRIGLLQRGA